MEEVDERRFMITRMSSGRRAGRPGFEEEVEPVGAGTDAGGPGKFVRRELKAPEFELIGIQRSR